jgi:hypothetical protein
MVGLGLSSWVTHMTHIVPYRYLVFTYRSPSIISLVTSFTLFRQPLMDSLVCYWYSSDVERHYPTHGSFLRHLAGNALVCLSWLYMLRKEFSRDPDLRWYLGSALLYSQMISYTVFHVSESVPILSRFSVKGIYFPWCLMTLHVLTGTWMEEHFLGMLTGVSYLAIKIVYRKINKKKVLR